MGRQMRQGVGYRKMQGATETTTHPLGDVFIAKMGPVELEQHGWATY